MGDFNTDLLILNNKTIQFNAVLEGIGLLQIIKEPTRITQDTCSLIDFIIINSTLNFSNCQILDASNISDHCVVSCNMEIKYKQQESTIRTYRDFSKLDADMYEADLLTVPWHQIYDIENVNDKVSFLNDNLLFLIDLHAPLKTARFNKPPSPWLTDNIRLMMSLRDKALNKYKRTKNINHWNYYKQLRNYTNYATKTEKKRYLEIRLQNSSNKEMWKNLRDLDINNKNKTLNLNFDATPDEVNTYFSNICSQQLPPNIDILNFYQNNLKTNATEKFKFNPVSEEDVLKVIMSLKSKALGLDGINLTIIQLSCPLILPYITHLINFCLENSVFPKKWKEGRIIPIPKINPPNELKNLRPITILPCLSKVLERLMEAQLREFLGEKDILPETQSGFRPGYSCSTALASIADDIMGELDNKKCGVLILLDYSKAFDTINHQILLAILHHIGLDTTAIALFKDYLTDRSQKVSLAGETSAYCNITRGIAQGSILGPLLYTIYTSNFPCALKACKVHMYADDTQLYRFFNKDDTAEESRKINDDLGNLISVSEKHDLKINSSKSSVMLFGNVGSNEIVIKLGDETLQVVEKAKNLGVIIDSNLRFTDHVSYLLQKSYAKLKLLYTHRHILSKKIKITLCESLVLSQFNYCDYVYGPCLTTRDASRLQKIQNSCLRYIHGIRKYDRISHTLALTHWLNMSNRRKLHANIFFFKLLRNNRPSYLTAKIRYRTDVHNLNIRRKGMLTIPQHKTTLFERSFSYNISRTVNECPKEYKSLSLYKFKKMIFKKLFDEQQVLPC